MLCGDAVAHSVAASPRFRAMPWMCLERCGDDIAADLKEMSDHRHELTAVSYEAFDLGDASTLIDNGFTNVGPTLNAMGLKTYPMITTVNITRIRTLASNVRVTRSAGTARMCVRGVWGNSLHSSCPVVLLSALTLLNCGGEGSQSSLRHGSQPGL